MAQRYAYQLTGIHHKRTWINGDLDSEFVPTESEIFPTRKAGNEYLKQLERDAKKNGYKTYSEYISRGEKLSELVIFTNDTWIHENTGEQLQEYYRYKLEKKPL